MISTRSLREQIVAIVKAYMDVNPWEDYTATRLTRAGAQIYAMQHGIFTRHSRRCWAYVVGNCPEVLVRRFIVRENLFEEEGSDETSHFVKLTKLGVALGLTEEQIVNAVPTIGLRGALLIWETLTKDRHWLIGLAAKGVLEMLNFPECGSFSATQSQRYMAKFGLTKDELSFHVTHDEVDKIHGAGALDLLGEYVPKYPEVSEREVVAAVEESMFAMGLFQGSAAKAADALAAGR